MSEADFISSDLSGAFTTQMRELARLVASQLADRTPYERSLILHAAHSQAYSREVEATQKDGLQ